MKWKQPPVAKIYEALGAVADGRVEIDGNTAKVGSSSGNKVYDVSYDPKANAIMANDNGSYWQGYLGYPAIVFLFSTGLLPYKSELADLLRGVKWKDVNQQFKNDFNAAVEHILTPLGSEKRQQLKAYVAETEAAIAKLELNLLGKKKQPPVGY